MQEEWRAVVGYEGFYEVSNNGQINSLTRLRVKSLIGGRQLKQKEKSGGYKTLFLCKNGVKKEFLVHRIVAQAFIPNPEKKPCVNHIDSNPSNNVVSNLEWCTYKENSNHSQRSGRWPNQKGVKNPSAKLNEKKVLTIRRSTESSYVLSKKFGVSVETVNLVKRGRIWQHVKEKSF